MWAYTPKEKFTVRSAYKIALDEAMDSRVGEPSNDDTQKILEKNLELEHAKQGEVFCLESIPKYTFHKSKLMQNVCEACGFGIESC